jgi:hypothetical protein
MDWIQHFAMQDRRNYQCFICQQGFKDRGTFYQDLKDDARKGSFDRLCFTCYHKKKEIAKEECEHEWCQYYSYFNYCVCVKCEKVDFK